MDWRDRDFISREQRETRRAIEHQTAYLATNQSLEAAKSRLSEARLALASEDNPVKKARLEKLVEEYADEVLALQSQLNGTDQSPGCLGCRVWFVLFFLAFFFFPQGWFILIPFFGLWLLWRLLKAVGSIFLKAKKDQHKETTQKEAKPRKPSQPASEKPKVLANIKALKQTCDQLEQQKQTWIEKVEQEIVAPAQETGEIDLDAILTVQKEGEVLRQSYQDLVETAAGDPRIEISGTDEMIADIDSLLASLQEMLASAKFEF